MWNKRNKVTAPNINENIHKIKQKKLLPSRLNWQLPIKYYAHRHVKEVMC